jgi:hypothetical protein
MTQNSKTSVNKRIQFEIQQLKEHESIIELLTNILALELDNSDKERIQFKSKYKEIFDKYVSH